MFVFVCLFGFARFVYVVFAFTFLSFFVLGVSLNSHSFIINSLFTHNQYVAGRHCGYLLLLTPVLHVQQTCIVNYLNN